MVRFHSTPGRLLSLIYTTALSYIICDPSLPAVDNKNLAFHSFTVAYGIDYSYVVYTYGDTLELVCPRPCNITVEWCILNGQDNASVIHSLDRPQETNFPYNVTDPHDPDLCLFEDSNGRNATLTQTVYIDSTIHSDVLFFFCATSCHGRGLCPDVGINPIRLVIQGKITSKMLKVSKRVARPGSANYNDNSYGCHFL